MPASPSKLPRLFALLCALSLFCQACGYWPKNQAEKTLKAFFQASSVEERRKLLLDPHANPAWYFQGNGPIHFFQMKTLDLPKADQPDSLAEVAVAFSRSQGSQGSAYGEWHYYKLKKTPGGYKILLPGQDWP